MERRLTALFFLVSLTGSACSDESTAVDTASGSSDAASDAASGGGNESTGGGSSTGGAGPGTGGGGTTSGGGASGGGVDAGAMTDAATVDATAGTTSSDGATTDADASGTSGMDASTSTSTGGDSGIGSDGGTSSGGDTGSDSGPGSDSGTGSDTGAGSDSGTSSDTGAGCTPSSVKLTTTEAFSLDAASCSCSQAGTLPWTSVGNVTADDGVYSVATRTGPGGPDRTELLVAVNFGFAIPGTATIQGVEVTVKRRTSSSAGVDDVVDALAQIWWGGATWGVDKANPDPWTTTDTVVTYGGPTDLWGLGPRFWDPYKLDDVSFGFALAADITQSTTAEVDHVTIEVFYCE